MCFKLSGDVKRCQELFYHLTFPGEISLLADVGRNALVQSHVTHGAPHLIVAHFHPSVAGTQPASYTYVSVDTWHSCNRNTRQTLEMKKRESERSQGLNTVLI